jgi:hypothetical protein
MLQQYFDSRTGRQLDESEAMENGILKSGCIMRTPMTARDSKMPRFTRDDYAMHRPGFRTGGTSFNDWEGRDAKREANKAYENALVNAWRKPAKLDAAARDDEDEDDQNPEGDGSGEIDGGAECPRYGGEGVVPAMVRATRNDERSIAQIARDHKAHMDAIYQDHARELSQMWRKG